AEFPFYIGTERVRVRFSADRPYHCAAPIIPCVNSVNCLGYQLVHHRLRIADQSFVSDVSHHTDNLASRLFILSAHVCGDALSYRVAVRPELLGHRFVDEYDGRGMLSIPLREHPSSTQRNSEDLKITR